MNIKVNTPDFCPDNCINVELRTYEWSQQGEMVRIWTCDNRKLCEAARAIKENDTKGK